jgi:Zn-dependent protease with chaperone function
MKQQGGLMNLDHRQIDHLLNEALCRLHPVSLQGLAADIQFLEASRLNQEGYEEACRYARLVVEPRQRGQYLSQGVKVTEKQFAGVHRLVRFAAGCFDMEPPHCYVVNIGTNAGAIGLSGQGTIVLSPVFLDILSPRELLSVIGHEITHLYHGDTAEGLLENQHIENFQKAVMSGRECPPEIFQNAKIAYNEKQKRETLADRGGLICCQDIESAQRALLKITLGNAELADAVDIPEYIHEHLVAMNYLPDSDNHLILCEHPYNALRLQNMQAFYETGYQQIIKTHGYKFNFGQIGGHHAP